MRAGGGATPRPAPLPAAISSTATLLVPASVAMPTPRLTHLRRLLLPLRSAAPHPLAPNPGRPLPVPAHASLLLLPRAMAGAAHAGERDEIAEPRSIKPQLRFWLVSPRMPVELQAWRRGRRSTRRCSGASGR